MLTSIFSSFEALYAESFGQKVGFSWASPAKEVSPVNQKGVSPIIKEDSRSREEGNRSISPVNHHEQEKPRRRPRFAPELDGVHCFETIVPF
ncbi:hypothetical protein NMG60_11017922 [Bertholletia excelsa]